MRGERAGTGKNIPLATDLRRHYHPAHLKRARPFIAVLLLLGFAASNPVVLPALLTAGAWLDGDHAVHVSASPGRLEVVLSHHDEDTHAAGHHPNSTHQHQHGWATAVLVAVAATSAPESDHVLGFQLSTLLATEHPNPALPVATPSDTLSPPTAQLVTLTTLPAVAPVAAARPPPVSHLLVSLRTTVLVV